MLLSVMLLHVLVTGLYFHLLSMSYSVILRHSFIKFTVCCVVAPATRISSIKLCSLKLNGRKASQPDTFSTDDWRLTTFRWKPYLFFIQIKDPKQIKTWFTSSLLLWTCVNTAITSIEKKLRTDLWPYLTADPHTINLHNGDTKLHLGRGLKCMICQKRCSTWVVSKWQETS